MQEDIIKENTKEKNTHTYIENSKDFNIKFPSLIQYPKSYPCIIKVTKVGIFKMFDHIYDISDFIYQNGILYKKIN